MSVAIKDAMHIECYALEFANNYDSYSHRRNFLFFMITIVYDHAYINHEIVKVKHLSLGNAKKQNLIMRSFPVWLPKSDERVENCLDSSCVPIAIAMGSLFRLRCHVLDT